MDYEEEYSKYLMQEVSFEPRDNDDFMAQLRLLERWHKKSIPQILEKKRPDAAYAIAMALCKHITLLINRDDIQEYPQRQKDNIVSQMTWRKHSCKFTTYTNNETETMREVPIGVERILTARLR